MCVSVVTTVRMVIQLVPALALKQYLYPLSSFHIICMLLFRYLEPALT